MSKQGRFDISSKMRYVTRILRHRLQGQPRVCPYCGPRGIVKLVRRKKVIVEVLECENCHLWFRWPMDTTEEHQEHYQSEFAVDAPQVMLPSHKELQSYKATNFRGSHLDISNKVEALKELSPGGRVLDFGSSWGYGTYQFQQSGFVVVGFEISRPRAEYGRTMLGLNVIDSYEELSKISGETFDIIFSNHVIEHLPELAGVFLELTRLLKPAGFVFHVLPNFTGRKARSGHWLKWIGEDHPIAPAIPFFRVAIPRAGLDEPVFASSPFDARLGKALKDNAGNALPTEGDELLVFAQKVAS